MIQKDVSGYFVSFSHIRGKDSFLGVRGEMQPSFLVFPFASLPTKSLGKGWQDPRTPLSKGNLGNTVEPPVMATS